MFHTASSSWQQESPLKVLISRATYPSQPEPNYALNLEVAEYVNQKKANTPREAAMTIAQMVNHRNPHVAMLALALLDTLVQSCGYPFQLQIATKEFLNELVRRFPERPPPYPGPVMSRILELIHGWKEGICVDSRWKDDFGNIRDMHRLLTFKGYRFRDMPRQQQQQTAASTVTSHLKTAEELENEDRDAQSAKLQELIRRGTPRDLAQAQELMKILAGANPDAKPDYKTQALTELNKLESKVILLNEMLDNVDTARGERFVQGDVYDQVASILTSARPKIQGWISNAESEDPESLDMFLQINDQINTVINRYEAFKKGDYAAAANPIPAEAQNDLSLIDFDDAPATSPPQQAPASGIDELASLFGPSSTAAQGQSARPQPQPPQQQPFAMPGSVFNQAPMAAPSALSPHAQSHAAMNMGLINTGMGTTPPGGIPGSSQTQTPTPTKGAIRLGSPNYFAAAGMTSGSPAAGTSSAGMGMGIGMGMSAGAMNGANPSPFGSAPMQPAQPQSQPQLQQPATSQTQTQGKDPFADLVGLF